MEPLSEIQQLISRHATTDRTATSIPGVSVMATDRPSEPTEVIYNPVVVLIAQGAKRTTLGNRIFEYGTGQYVVVPIDLPVTGQVVTASSDQPFLAVGMTLRPASISPLLLEMTAQHPLPAEAAPLSISDARDDFLDSIVRLLRLLDRPQDVTVMKPMIEREIIWRLLNGGQGAAMRAIGHADSRLSQIGRATRWIRAHFAEALRVETLAGVAGMSSTSFHRHFRAVTSLSPLQYQKQVRLHEARALLLAESRDAAAIGYDVGYDSPSQFSREYARMFGMPPARDAARLRTRIGRTQALA